MVFPPNANLFNTELEAKATSAKAVKSEIRQIE